MSFKRCFSANDPDFLDALTASDDEFRIGSNGLGMFCRNVKYCNQKITFIFYDIEFSFDSEDEGPTVVLAAPEDPGEFVLVRSGRNGLP